MFKLFATTEHILNEAVKTTTIQRYGNIYQTFAAIECTVHAKTERGMRRKLVDVLYDDLLNDLLWGLTRDDIPQKMRYISERVVGLFDEYVKTGSMNGELYLIRKVLSHTTFDWLNGKGVLRYGCHVRYIDHERHAAKKYELQTRQMLLKVVIRGLIHDVYGELLNVMQEIAVNVDNAYEAQACLNFFENFQQTIEERWRQ